ncbi:hypothetical protein GCM10010912_38800 [Paenibacillus albidus]|uniref:Uncharacterized protein n=1 Tax=Paenibacillus albidus TaxID=2041023 RepID=A0A917CIZ5_9BACL|nr:hypothetical protein GCM10010912_38800 [Paenibacillus albidus]
MPYKTYVQAPASFLPLLMIRFTALSVMASFMAILLRDGPFFDLALFNYRFPLVET